MGVKTRNRIVDRPVIPPKDIDINDEGYRGQHPDAIDYPHEETFSDGRRTVELKAFTKKGLAQLRRIAEEQFLPLLEAENLNCAVLCEKRRDSGTGRITLGVCFNSGRGPQERGERQAIMLRHPDADDPRVAYTLLHELAHLTEDSHLRPWKVRFGELASKAVADGTPFSHWRLDLLALAKGDRYNPIPPQGTWDDYFNGTPALDYAVIPGQQSFAEELESYPAAALTVDTSYGVKDWGFTDDLAPKGNAQALSVEVNLQELVERYLDQRPDVLEELPNGGFSWNTKDMGWAALAPLYGEQLAARGIGKRRIKKLLEPVDFRAIVRNSSEAIEPILDAEVRRRRADSEEVPF
jgi:hypothetical protein